MPDDTLEMIAKLAATASQRRGLRSGCQAMVEILNEAIGALYSFVFVEDAERNEQQLVAGTGLTPTEFRRLDERLNRTALLRALEYTEVTRLLINDEPTLDFLVRPETSAEIVCSPVVSTSRTIGAVAVAFDKKKVRPSSELLKGLEISASLVHGHVNSAAQQEDEGRRLEEHDVSAKQERRRRYDLSRLIGNSGAMRSVHDKVAQIARSNAPVLLRGESGTGKELIAAAIHHNSFRANSPFVKVDCSAVADASLDAEIFGNVSGDVSRPGRIREAHGGTLFLDEIADIPQRTQIRLLRLMQEHRFEPECGWETLRSNVRIIAGSERPLEELVADGIFRENLFSQLSIYSIYLPPLRERKADILLLADHFLKKYSREHGKNILRISTPAIDMLTAYHFPGNVKELENAVESAVLNTDGSVIHSHHFPPTLQTAEESGTETRLTLESGVSNFERGMISDALKSTRGNIAKAASMLESTERILGYKIRKYNIDPKRFK